MKRLFIIFMVVFSLAFTFSVLAAEEQEAPVWSAEVIPVCQGVCLEGKQVIWQVQIRNVGSVPFDLQQIGFVDSEGIIFAFNDLTGQQSTIAPNQVGTVNVQGTVPPPTRGSTLYYKMNYVVGDNVYPDANFRRMVVFPIADVECTSNDFCERNEVCAGYRCTPYSLFNSSEVPKPENNLGTDQIQTMLLVLVVVLLLVLLLVIVMHKHKK